MKPSATRPYGSRSPVARWWSSTVLVLLGITVLCDSSPSAAREVPADATALYERYVALESAGDLDFFGLFAADAMLLEEHPMVSGHVRRSTTPVAAVARQVKDKDDLRALRGESTYDEPRFEVVEDVVQVVVERSSSREKSSGTVTLRLTHHDEHGWRITQERLESSTVLKSDVPPGARPGG